MCEVKAEHERIAGLTQQLQVCYLHKYDVSNVLLKQKLYFSKTYRKSVLYSKEAMD